MSSSTTGYNLIFALTEATINSQFQDMYNQYGFIPKQINVSAGNNSTDRISAKMYAPTIEVTISPANPQQIWFYLHLYEGTFTYTDASGNPQTTAIGTWDLRFTVNLDQIQMTDGFINSGLVPTTVKNQYDYIKRTVSNAYMFGLFLSFENLSHFDPGIVIEGQQITPSDDKYAAIITGMQHFIDEITTVGNPYIISYTTVDSTESIKPDAPALIPTSAGMSATPFINPSSDQQKWQSTVNTNIMSLNRSNSNANAGIYSNNWCNFGSDDSDLDGTFIMDNSVFESAYVEDQILPAVKSALLSFSDLSGHDSGFKQSVTQDWSGGNGSWTIKVHGDNYDEHGGQGYNYEKSWAKDLHERSKIDINCTATTQAGPNQEVKVHFTGTFEVKAEYATYTLGIKNTKYTFRSTWDLDFTITLDAASQGTISYTVDVVEDNDPDTDIDESFLTHLEHLSEILIPFGAIFVKSDKDQATHSKRRCPRRTAQSLLTTAIRQINSPLINIKGNPTET
ncbi:MAG: hypothetical protein AAF242_18700, partial [Bacteroidota bacterium]